MLDVREYLEEDRYQSFRGVVRGPGRHFGGQITFVPARIKQGNLSNVKASGDGAGAPGWISVRATGVYFGRDGDVLVILLTDGKKKRQERGIEATQARWAAYERRKRLAR